LRAGQQPPARVVDSGGMTTPSLSYRSTVSLSATLLIIAATTACIPPRADVTRLNMAPRPMAPRPAESVQLFLTQAPPGGVEVYLLKMKGGLDDVRLEALRTQAGELGCDGLAIVESVADVSATARDHDPKTSDITVTEQGHVTGVCLVWPGPGPGPG